MAEQFGKYRILGELGHGGFATVHRAVDTTLDREVALKILDPLLVRDTAWVARFRREARAVANLRHPHIIDVYEIAEVEERLYIAMKLARGGSLAEAIQGRGRLPWDETLALLQPVCQALDHAHEQGVIHRDLKPANLLLDPDEGPLLTDFGFARLMGDNSVSLSLSGGILGTPAYIAPEIWELDQAEIPADIYALGCIVHEMLTGRVLFEGRTPMQSMRAHDQGPRYAAAWPEDVPGGIVNVLDRALAREASARYPSAGALWHALTALTAEAEAAREAVERAAVAAGWRAEAEAALAAGEGSVARMAVGRWLAVAPGDPAALAMQAEVARRVAEAEHPVTVTQHAPGARDTSSDAAIAPPASPAQALLASSMMANSTATPQSIVADPRTTARHDVPAPAGQPSEAPKAFRNEPGAGSTLEQPVARRPDRTVPNTAVSPFSWRWWGFANLLGFGAGLVALWLSSSHYLVLTSSIFGASVGVSQWLLLRRRIPFAYRWLPVTCIGLSSSVYFFLEQGGLLALLSLAAVATLQYFILRASLRKAEWWLVASLALVFWAFAFPLMVFLYAVSTGALLSWLLKHPQAARKTV